MLAQRMDPCCQSLSASAEPHYSLGTPTRVISAHPTEKTVNEQTEWVELYPVLILHGLMRP